MGTAGICVLVVFLSGFLIWKLSDTASPAKIKLVKFYMKVCLIIAGISFVSGLLNFFVKQSDVNFANTEKTKAEKESSEIMKIVEQELPKIEKAQNEIAEVKSVINSGSTITQVNQIQVKANLDTATKAINTIDVGKLKNYIKKKPINTATDVGK
jgi:hypoxanthine-guanine phosphoribosyltransferase